MKTALSLLSALTLVAGAVHAKPPPKGKSPPTGKTPPGKLSCPAANKVNTVTEDKLGCPVVVARSYGPLWAPATKADFVKQSGGRAFGEMKPQGTGGIRCVKFFKKKPDA